MRVTINKITALFLVVVMSISVLVVSSVEKEAKAYGETFIIDPGHGGEDPGALLGDRLEKDDVLRLSLRVGELVSPYASLTYTRTADTTLSLQQRCNIANNNDNTYFISIHRNAADSSLATGIETYYCSYNSSTSLGAKMAGEVNRRIADAVPWANRGVKTELFTVITNTNMPACLTEVGFITNPSDNALFDQYFEEIAHAIANGMLAMIGESLDDVPADDNSSSDSGNESVSVTNKLDGNSYIDMGQDFYARVKHTASGKYITDIDGNITTSSYTGGEEQVWHFMRQANGAYLVGNSATRKFWDVENSSYTDGTNLISNSVTFEDNQKFYIYDIDGSYYFMPAGGDKTLDVDEATGNVRIFGSTTGESATSSERLARSMKIENIEDDVEETELVIKSDSSFFKDGAILNNVSNNQTASNILSNFDNQKAVVYDGLGNQVDGNAVVGTGDTVNLIVNGEKIDSLTIVVKGDVDGTGKIDSTDYMRIKSIFLKTFTAEDIYKKAADVDSNGVVDNTDYLRVKNHILGSFDIFS